MQAIAGKREKLGASIMTAQPCAQELVHGIKNARLHAFQHSGHYPFMEEFESFQELIRTFLTI